MARWPRKPKTSWPAEGLVWPVGSGPQSCPCAQHWGGHALNPVSSSVSLQEGHRSAGVSPGKSSGADEGSGAQV